MRRRRSRSGLFAACAGCALCAGGAAVAEVQVVTAERMLDPARGVVVRGGAVVIDDGQIIAAGPLAAMTLPAGAAKIDLGDATLLPGLIDLHVHLSGPATKGRGYDGLQYPAERNVIWGVKHARETLLAGFTTVRNVGSPGYEILAVRDAVNEGEVPGPRIFAAGPPVGIVGGHCSDQNYLPHDAERRGVGTATGPWDMREKVRRNIKFGVDLIKTCSTGGVFSKGTLLGAPQSTVEELKAIVDEAHMRGLKVASHAHGVIGIKNAIEAGVDSIEHASFLDDEAIRLAREKGVAFVMDIYNTEFTLSQGAQLGVPEESLAKEREVGDVQRESFRKAVKAGAIVAFGTDAAIYPHGDNARQFAVMVRYGMTPMQAIQAATTVAADVLGKKGELGCLDPGCRADIIAVKGDPLADISILERTSFVMKAGDVYKQ